jgi:tRNA(adenine34) deaminase
MTSDEAPMRLALEMARLARDLNEAPIGCVIVHVPSGRVVGKGHNRRILDHDPTAHAEIVAMRLAGTELGNWRLDECDLFVTLEPCPMCAGAMVNARIRRVVYGCADPKAGAADTLYHICDDPRLNHRLEVVKGILAEECSGILSEFFRMRRK